MAIHYRLISKNNLQHPEAPPKFYALAKSVGELTLADLADKISKGSTTVSDTDVLAVLNEAAKLVEVEIVEGNIVRFGRLGSFSITLSSEGRRLKQLLALNTSRLRKLSLKLVINY